jgi:signal peptidase I
VFTGLFSSGLARLSLPCLQHNESSELVACLSQGEAAVLTLALLGLLLIFFFGTNALLLWAAARLARIPRISFLWSVLTFAVVGMASALIAVAFAVIPFLAGLPLNLPVVLQLLIGPLLSWLLIAWLFRTSFSRAILAWLGLLVGAGVNVAVLFLVVQPFLLDALIVPANAMAPTLVGPHKSLRCPKCGGSLVVSFHRQFGGEGLDSAGICEECQQVTVGLDEDAAGERPRSRRAGESDRFICNKLLSPQRWDLVVFRRPADPNVLWVQRLVGLPGEEVVIKEGAVWIDGKKIQPPEDITSLKYIARLEGEFENTWGSPEKPARLGADEYFVLGDFTNRAWDSRLWPKGAAGHPSYAVPRSHIVGVATLIYWPQARWRIFR